MKYDGKFASRWRAKSPDALCAVLPYDTVTLSHSPAAAIPIVKQLWLEFFLLKLAHFFISEVAQVFIRNRTLDFTNAEDVFLHSIKNLQ